jgi:hypothetical protein
MDYPGALYLVVFAVLSVCCTPFANLPVPCPRFRRFPSTPHKDHCSLLLNMPLESTSLRCPVASFGLKSKSAYYTSGTSRRLMGAQVTKKRAGQKVHNGRLTEANHNHEREW